jgi:hypothetical protein
MNGLKQLTLDETIKRLQGIRTKAGKDMPLRYVDGYDNALGVHCVSVEENTNWENEPDSPFVCLS